MSSAVAQKFVNANMLVMPMFKMSSNHIILIMKHTCIHTLHTYIILIYIYRLKYIQGESIKNIPHEYFANILSMIRNFSQNFTSLLHWPTNFNFIFVTGKLSTVPYRI